MEYTLSGIRNRILDDKLDDLEFDPTVIDNFINDTQRYIFNQYELSFQEKIFSGVIPTGSTIFKLPTDVAEIQSQTITSPVDGGQRSLKDSYIDFRSFNSMYPTPGASLPGPIGRWTLYANNMLTSAPTDKEYTMTIFYISKPVTLSAEGDIPQIPEEFAELLVLGAFMRVQKRNEDFDLAIETEKDYDKIMLQLVSRYGFRKADGPIIMKLPRRR